MGKYKVLEVGLSTLQSLWIIKKGTRYNHPFYMYLVCHQGISYFALRAVGWVILKDIISGPFNYIEQNDYLKIFIGCV